MIKTLRVKDFTRFDNATLSFSRNLNVFAGQNGTGKSQLMKLLYVNLRSLMRDKNGQEVLSKTYLETAIARKLKGVFRPDTLGRLTRRQQGQRRAEVEMTLRDKTSLAYSFSTRSTEAVVVETCPSVWNEDLSVFLPTREMLSLYPNFVSIYESVEIPFEETWRDLALMLGRPLRTGPRFKEINNLLAPLEAEDVLGGSVVLEHGRFYLRSAEGKLEAHLLAEGMRKIATIAQLIANGSLTQGSVLFWDEPEANLNPTLIRKVAHTIMALVRHGTQVFIATHSLFLLRELYLASHQDSCPGISSYFSLIPEENGRLRISSAEDLNALEHLASLDAQVAQDEQLLELFSHGI